jgi:DNA-binding NarL/FixJ family response regulator
MVSGVRILVADDYQDWRHQIRQMLRVRPEWQVIYETSDGLETVEKTEELKPDVVLLDIGLPKLNGIEAARQIRQRSPDSKIIFFSLDNSLEVVQVALNTGAYGYVYKARAGSELLPAIEAVLGGKQFVSSMLRGYRFTEISGSRSPYRHEVQFYSDDAVLLGSFAGFVADALRAGDVAIAVTTEFHRDGLVQKLKAQGLDVDAATRQGTYVPVDVANELSAFMVNGMPDSTRFFEVVGGLITSAAKAGKPEYPRVGVCREGGALLRAEGKVDAAIRLEQLWGQIALTYEVNILCGYASGSFHRRAERVFQSICAEHSAVYSR